VNAEVEHIWARVQAELARAVDEPTYRIWLGPLRALSLSNERLSIEAPAHARGWISERFGGILNASVALVLGPHAVVELVSGDNSTERSDIPPPTGAAAAGRGAGADTPWRRGAHVDPPSTHDRSGGTDAGALALAALPGNPKLTFEQFVIGDSNRLAHAAALTVAEVPAQAYNPLFICGPPGVGKTHLLSSIANLLLSHSPGLTVRYTTGEAFTNEFLNSLGGGQTDMFKARFRHVDLLLLDDVQFLERKARTEEEFFHTFNALHDGGRQIVITSDRPPHDLQALEDRLRERFAAGLVTDIQPPDLTTRLAILRKRTQHDHIDLADGVALEVIARRVDCNVRALEGALIRIVAFSSLTGRAFTADLANEVLDRLYPRSSSSRRGDPRSISDIQQATCEHFGISPEELLSSSRTTRIAWPRQVAMYLARELTGESLPAIGRHFGGRDHTTVLHACRRTTARIADDDDARRAVDRLRETLGIASS
jgi:chromosomal replication initiator protein